MPRHVLSALSFVLKMHQISLYKWFELIYVADSDMYRHSVNEKPKESFSNSLASCISVLHACITFARRLIENYQLETSVQLN